MIHRHILCLWIYCWVLWHYSFFRFGTFHVPVGALNYTVAFMLFWYAGVDKYTATTAGHFVHVTIGFFYDRDVTFRAIENRGKKALTIYWFNEALSYTSILLTIYLLVDLYEVHLLLTEYKSWPEEWAIAAVRAVPAMIIGTAITYGLNKIWTFNESSIRLNSRELLAAFFCGHESLSRILHCVQILLSVLDPTRLFFILGN